MIFPRAPPTGPKGGLDPSDEEDAASLLDFLDSAGGFHFCNEGLGRALQRLMEGGEPAGAAQVPVAGMTTTSRGTARVATTGPVPVQPAGVGPRPAATLVTPCLAAPNVQSAGETMGPSGRRWDYSRFDAIRESSDEETGLEQ